MTSSLKFFGISGSLRKASFNTELLRGLAALAPSDVTFDIYEDLRNVPPYDDDVRAAGMPEVVTKLIDRVRVADAVVIAIPEYNYSVPGVLKNAIDWISRAQPSVLADKPLGIVGASAGAFGTARSQYHLRQIAVFLDMHVMNKPEVMVTSAYEKFDKEGKLTDEPTKKILGTFVNAFRDWTIRLKK